MYLLKWIIAFLMATLSGNLALSQSMKMGHTLWMEFDENVELSENDGVGFLYPYNLPDTRGEAIVLFRSYKTPINSGLFSNTNDDSLISSLNEGQNPTLRSCMDYKRAFGPI